MFRNLITVLLFTVFAFAAGQVATTQPATAGTDEAAAAAKADGENPDAADTADAYPFTDLAPDSYWMPAKGTGDTTDHVDWMFYTILGLAAFCFLAISIVVLYLVWRYRHRDGHKAESSAKNNPTLEVVWTVIPAIICVFIFVGGWKGYLSMTTAPGDAMQIEVSAGVESKWAFTYNKGEETLETAELHVPVDRAVKLKMRSKDVVHSFSVPSFRKKQDVVPGRYSYLWFEADTPGVYRVYCAEYCGDSHSQMKTQVVVHKSGGYEKWLNAEFKKGETDCLNFEGQEQTDCFIAQGKEIYMAKGCIGCHTLDGVAGAGPSFKGIWGETREFTDGTSGVVDEDYIRESIFEPMVKIRTGFGPVMPSFEGKLTDKDIDALNNWLKTL
ncbi:MAG: cytochrome c oxidase subunit II [Myxococcales bacterium]|nr:cytochrome c oxidase subunit II [Myxococcales bacterium]